jgi:hypothetical protein
VISESRSLEVERKVGGRFHLKLNISLKPIANKYHEGKMKRTLKRGLKVFEFAERKMKETNSSTKIDMCIGMYCFLVLKSAVVHCCGRLESMMLSCWKAFIFNAAHSCTILLTKWFFSTRLETRTKESSTCASSQVASLCAKLK